MRRPIVAGNWKMHGSRSLIEKFALCLDQRDGVDAMIFPSAPYLPLAVERLEGLEIGVQNVHADRAGAYTGEIAAEMAAELGVRFALVGHSERRRLFSETDAVVAAKYRAALRAGLVPILCVGETLEQRRQGREAEVVLSQLDAVLEPSMAGDAIIAYEPVWAIGTGETATPSQAQAMHATIREALGDRRARILYGGSVTAENARALFAEDDIDGGLVGGASLEPTSFNAITHAATG